MVASLFTTLNHSAIIPKDWGLAIIIPICKKDKRDEQADQFANSDQQNVYQTSTRETDWLEIKDILRDELAGFRTG